MHNRDDGLVVGTVVRPAPTCCTSIRVHVEAVWKSKDMTQGTSESKPRDKWGRVTQVLGYISSSFFHFSNFFRKALRHKGLQLSIVTDV